MLTYDLGIRNSQELTQSEISQLTKKRLTSALFITNTLEQQGWSLVCKQNKLLFTHPNILSMPDTTQHLINLNIATEPLMYSSGQTAVNALSDDFEDDFGDDDDDDIFDDDDDDDDDDIFDDDDDDDFGDDTSDDDDDDYDDEDDFYEDDELDDDELDDDDEFDEVSDDDEEDFDEDEDDDEDDEDFD